MSILTKIKQDIDEDIKLTDFEAEIIDQELTKIRPTIEYIVRRYIKYIAKMA